MSRYKKDDNYGNIVVGFKKLCGESIFGSQIILCSLSSLIHLPFPETSEVENTEQKEGRLEGGYPQFH